jgi:Tol biopolymer transport system component
MSNKNYLNVLCLLFGMILIIPPLFAQVNEAEKLYEEGVYMLEAVGDFTEAIKLFDRVANEYSKNKSIAANALLKLGICYERLGSEKASEAYEHILEKYSDQKEQVTMARARLAELKRDKPAGLSVVDLDLDVPGFSNPFDLSPDGTKVLGVQIGKGQNIVVCDLENKKVKFITHYDWSEESSFTWIPIWSPDGKAIVYTANKGGPGGIRLMKSSLNGQSQILISTEKHWIFPNTWMPDGKAILTTRGEINNEDTQELGLIPSEGGEFKKLISVLGNVESWGGDRAQACVSPDGRFIAYTNIDMGGEKNIFVMSSDGKTSWLLAGHPAAQEHPRWSPDGKYIVFRSLRHGSWALWGVAVEEGKAKGDPFMLKGGMEGVSLLNWTSNGLTSYKRVSIHDIFLMDVNPATGDPIGEPRILGYTPTGGNRWPTWAPDGEHIAFLKFDKNSPDRFQKGFSVTVVRSDGSGSRDYPVPGESSGAIPRWSPDGNSIGMCVGNIVLWLDLATEQWKTIPVKGEWSIFEWSANGQAFLFGKNGHADIGAGIIERDLKTGEQRYVYRPAQRASFRSLKYSRDYKWLAFLESMTKIVVLNLKTGESHLAAKYLGPPSWSSDGQKIMAMRAYDFSRNKEQFKSLFVLPASGGPIKEFDLSKSLPKEGRIMMQDWSPDGKQVVLEFRQSIRDVVLYKNVIPEGK